MSTESPVSPSSPSSQPVRPRSRIKPWLARLILLAVSLFLVLLLCEVAVRLFVEPFIMPRWVESTSYGIRKQLGNIRGFIVTPQYRHRLSTNSKGFRGVREYAVPKPTNVFRVMVLGDSVVNGYGVEDDETFCAVLEKKLSGKRPTEVMNLGIPGFGNAEELIQLEHVGFEYQPDLVILGYFINDHFENLTSGLFQLKDGKLVQSPQVSEPSIFLRDRLSQIPGYTFLCQHSYLINFLRNKASGFFRQKLGLKHTLPPGSYTSDKPTEEQIALTTALVDEIIHRCHERNIKTLILNIPMEQQGVWIKNLPVDRLKSKDQTPIVDVEQEIWKTPDIYSIAHKGSYHPKALGHQLIADWLADYIEQKVWTQAQLAK